MRRLRTARWQLAALVVVLLLPFVARSRAGGRADRRGRARDAGHRHRQQRIDPLRVRPRVPRAHGAARAQRRRRLALAGRRRRDRPHLASEYAASFERHWRAGSAPALDRPRSRPASRAAAPDGRGAATSRRRGGRSSRRTSGRRRHAVRRRQPRVREARRGGAARRRGDRRGATPSCSARAASRPSSAARRSGIATGAGSARACRASASATTATRWRGSASPSRRRRGARSPSPPTAASSRSPIRRRATSGKAFEMIVQKQMTDARRRAEAARRQRTPRRWTTSRRARAGPRRCGSPAHRRQRALLHRPVDQDPARRRDRATRRPGCASTSTGASRPRPRAAAGRPGSVGFVTARGETSIDADPDRPPARGAAPRARRSRSSSSCCPTKARSCGASGAAYPADRSATRCAASRSSRTSTTTPSTPYRADPDEQPVRGGARLRLPPRLDRAAVTARSSFVVRVMCVDPEPELQEAYDALARGRLPAARRRRCSTTSRRSTTRRSAGPLRAALQSPDPMDEARWSIRLVERLPRAIPPRDRAGAGGQVTR